MIKFKAVFSSFTIGASLSRPSRPSPTRLLLFAWKCSIYEKKTCANKFEREIFTRVLFYGKLTTVFGGIIARAFWLCVECETAFHSSFVKWQPIVGELSTPNCWELSVVMLSCWVISRSLLGYFRVATHPLNPLRLLTGDVWLLAASFSCDSVSVKKKISVLAFFSDHEIRAKRRKLLI